MAAKISFLNFHTILFRNVFVSNFVDHFISFFTFTNMQNYVSHITGENIEITNKEVCNYNVKKLKGYHSFF